MELQSLTSKEHRSEQSVRSTDRLSFLDLPVEVRELVYLHFIGDEPVYIGLGQPNSDYLEENVLFLTTFQSFYFRTLLSFSKIKCWALGRRCPDWREWATIMKKRHPRTIWSSSYNLLLSCRTVCREARHLLFTQIEFRVANPFLLLCFTDTLSSRTIPMIKNLRISIYYDGENPQWIVQCLMLQYVAKLRGLNHLAIMVRVHRCVLISGWVKTSVELCEKEFPYIASFWICFREYCSKKGFFEDRIWTFEGNKLREHREICWDRETFDRDEVDMLWSFG